MTSPKVIFNAIFPVPVKILNSYKVTQEESDTFRKSLGLDLRKVLLEKRFVKQETGRKRTTGQKGDSMEESYESFAGVYDLFMDNIDYPAWCTYLTGILKEYGIEDGLIAELGCGTGSMTELLAAEGYDMIGIDNSRICWRSPRKNGWNPVWIFYI